MKKQLLFAAMLMLSAAPAVSVSAAQTFAAAAEEGQTLATQEQYDALVKSIAEVQQNIDAMLKEINDKYPDAEDTKNSLNYNKESLDKIADEAKAKFDAKTLTAAEVKNYQSSVNEIADGLKDAVKNAALEVYSFQVNSSYNAAYMHKAECLGQVPENVQNYYAPAFDELDADMMQIYMSTMMSPVETAEQAKKMCDQYDAISKKADALLAASKKASTLVEDITATLASLNEEIEKVKKDFPEFDLSMVNESAEYWKNLAAEFAKAPADPAAPYTEDKIDGFAQEFGYFKENVSGLYAQAQKDEWMAQFNAKYTSANSKMAEYFSILDSECPTVASDYFTKLDDLNAELTQMYMKLYQEDLTQKQFDAMMARIDKILVEAQKIIDEAKEAEKVATGISNISVSEAVKAGKVYSIDGKRVSKSVKGLVIINGKKVILK